MFETVGPGNVTLAEREVVYCEDVGGIEIAEPLALEFEVETGRGELWGNCTVRSSPGPWPLRLELWGLKEEEWRRVPIVSTLNESAILLGTGERLWVRLFYANLSDCAPASFKLAVSPMRPAYLGSLSVTVAEVRVTRAYYPCPALVLSAREHLFIVPSPRLLDRLKTGLELALLVVTALAVYASAVLTIVVCELAAEGSRTRVSRRI